MANSKDNKRDSLLRRQVVGLVLTLVLAAGFIAAMYLTDRHLRDTIHRDLAELDTAAIDSFICQLEERKYESRYPQYDKPKRDTVPLRLHPFDPNTADSVELLELGLRPWQARTLIRYRQKGARFRKTEDVKKLFFMNDSLYAALLPFINISLPADTAQTDTAKHGQAYVPRLKKDTIIELNSADTATLQLLRGVGRYTAVQIVRYRQQLGGYVSPEQLREIDNINIDTLLPHFTADATLVNPIPVNKASVDRLNRHPYIRFEQAKCLYNLRREHISLTLDIFLREQDCFTQDQLQQVLPYLSFD